MYSIVRACTHVLSYSQALCSIPRSVDPIDLDAKFGTPVILVIPSFLSCTSMHNANEGHVSHILTSLFKYLLRLEMPCEFIRPHNLSGVFIRLFITPVRFCVGADALVHTRPVVFVEQQSICTQYWGATDAMRPSRFACE